jgi:hypothetical protein
VKIANVNPNAGSRKLLKTNEWTPVIMMIAAPRAEPEDTPMV